ncbi:MAG: hypothetical protein FJ291_02060 [Planctomycetes bacterium]|nr:hypothetical protein [Planctomycetota bacterium]
MPDRDYTPDENVPSYTRQVVGTPDAAEQYTVSASCPVHGTASAKLYVVEVRDINFLSDSATDIAKAENTPYRTDICAAIRPVTGSPGYVYLKATIYPEVDESLVANFIYWSGGEAVDGHPLQRRVSKAAWAKHTVTASIGTTSYTMLVYIIGAQPTGYSPENGELGEEFPDNSRNAGTSTGVFATWDANTPVARHYCQIQFTVQPPELIADGDQWLFDRRQIQWDVTREMRRIQWDKLAGGDWSILEYWSLITEWRPDDDPFYKDGDNDNEPWGPNGNGHLYAVDMPGLRGTVGEVEAMVQKHNMREWVRVSLDWASGREGVRCSDYSFWHSSLSIEKDGETWKWDPTYQNKIPPQHDFWGTTPTNFLRITTGSLPNASVGVPYSREVTSENGSDDVRWTLDMGSLPPGLTHTENGSIIIISGTPTTPGVYTFTLEARDYMKNPQEAALKTFTITVDGN